MGILKLSLTEIMLVKKDLCLIVTRQLAVFVGNMKGQVLSSQIQICFQVPKKALWVAAPLLMPGVWDSVRAVLALITKRLIALRQSIVRPAIIMGTHTNGVSQGKGPGFAGGPN